MITYPLNRFYYNATDAELFHCTRNSGIYAGDDFVCTVTGADNNVTIGTGIGWIRNSKFSGKVIANKSDVVLDLGLADASFNRWDIVAIQFDKNNNATDFVVKHGTPASTPVRPEIVQTETLYELYLAAFYRKAGATTITASDVYDLRLDPTVCGLMADNVTEIDTTGINAQINALVEELREEIANIKTDTNTMLKSVYDTDNDNVVDLANDAKMLDGFKSSHFATKANTDHTDDGLLTTTALKNGIAKLGVVGKSRKSKNLLENKAVTQTKNGITFTVNDDKSVTVNSTENTGFFFKVGTISLPAGSYKLSGCPAGGSGTTYRLALVTSVTDVGNGATVTFDASVTLDVEIRIEAGTVLNNLTFKPMVRLASETDDTYEPFGITSVGEDGTTELMVTGKTLIDWENYDYLNRASNLKFDKETGALTYDYDGNHVAAYYSAEYLMGQTVIFDYEKEENSNGDSVSGYLFVGENYDNTREYIHAVKGQETYVPNYYKSLQFAVCGNNSPTVQSGTFSITGIGLYLADETDLSYEAPQIQSLTLPITLHGIPVDEGGNYTDESGQQWIADTAEIADGNVVVTRNVRKAIVDEKADLYRDVSGVQGSYFYKITSIQALPSQNSKKGAVICDRLETLSANENFNNKTDSIAINSSGNVAVWTDAWKTITVDEVKAELAKTPLTIVYALAEPTTETYEIDQIVNQSGTVNIIQPDGAGLIATLSGAASAAAVDNAQQAADNAQQAANAAIPKGAVTAILLVDALPENPDATTLYLVP